MYALIDDASGRVLDWRSTPFTPAGGQLNIDVPDWLNLVEASDWRWQKSVAILSSTIASPTVVTCATAHGMTTGAQIQISGHSVVIADPQNPPPNINGFHTVTVIDATSFTVPVAMTVAGTGGSIVAGIRAATAAEKTAARDLQKDATVEACFGAGGQFDQQVLKAAFAAVMKKTHDYLQAIETAAGLPTTTVPNFSTFVSEVKADFKSRL